MRIALCCVVFMTLAGCGPMSSPMLPKLEADQQRQVDQVWENMLTPVSRIDRQTLLDANVMFWLYTMGVDRMHMTSLKYFSGGTAVMEIDCDRASPDSDQFTITVLDRQGRTVRRERYGRKEVEESTEMVGLPRYSSESLKNVRMENEAIRPATGPSTPATTRATPVESEQERKRRLEQERRIENVMAATQPAAKK